MYMIKGFKINIDKTPDRWRGSIFLDSHYKSLSEYVSSSKESFGEAIIEILERYSHKGIKGIELHELKSTQVDEV